MKNYFSYSVIFLCIIFTQKLTAQICGTCIIDYGLAVPGVYPDTLPHATAGEYYESDITMVFPTDTTVPLVGTLDFLNFHIMQPVGMPYGINVSTNLGDFPVDYDPGVSLYGCAQVCGTPLIPGWYEVTVPLVATLEFPGGDQPAEYNIYMQVLPAAIGGGGIIPSASYGCEPLTVDFETGFHSDGVSGYSYIWDFGNGSTSTSEFPPSQTYTATDGIPTDYVITHTVSIDTIGYSLDYVTAVASGCDDCTIFGCTGLIEAEKPDLYILIDALGLDTSPGVPDTYPPVTWSLGIELDPAASYTLKMKDEDGGLAGDDDNCGTFYFNGDDVGVSILTAGSHTMEVGITHPVISYTFYDTITVYPQPAVPDVAALSETIFCEGDSVELDASVIGGVEYQWLLDGDEIPEANTTTYVAYSSGSYSVVVTAEGGCFATSDSTLVVVYENPIPPSIFTIGNVMYTSSPFALQWYYSGSPIPGATNATYTPAVEGTYQVSATNGPCVAWSSEIIFEFQSVDNLIGVSSINIFPNPNDGIFNYEISLTQKQNVKIKLLNMLGEEIYSVELNNAAGKINNEINVKNEKPGIYFIHFEGETFNAAIKLIIE